MERFRLADVEGLEVLDVEMPAWMGRGNCASSGSELATFFVEETHREATEQTLAAKRICAVGMASDREPRPCPVRRECLAWALELEAGEAYREGIFGGLSPSERIFASQAADPVAFGLSILDEQVRVGQIVQPVERFEEVGADGEAGSGRE